MDNVNKERTFTRTGQSQTVFKIFAKSVTKSGRKAIKKRGKKNTLLMRVNIVSDGV